MYIQVVPIFLKSDADAARAIADGLAEIDAMTGPFLQFVVATEIAAGDAAGVADLFAVRSRPPRYPGLLRSDLPCFWVEDGEGGHAIIRMSQGQDLIVRCIRAMTDAAQAGRSAPQIKAWVRDRLAYDVGERNPLLRAVTDALRSMVQELEMSKSSERLLAFVFGVIFVAAILALAVVFPQPSPFQYQVFRIVLALAAAGFVSMTPGFLQVTIANFLRAGGALAVFAIVYFYNPAALIVSAGQ